MQKSTKGQLGQGENKNKGGRATWTKEIFQMQEIRDSKRGGAPKQVGEIRRARLKKLN